MGSDIGDYDRLAEQMKEEYEEKSIFGELVSQSVSNKDSQTTYYKAGKIEADMREDFLVPITATRFVDYLVDTEKTHVIEEVETAADQGDIDVNSVSDYSHSELISGFGNVRDPSVLLLPSKKGRPMNLTDDLHRTGMIPYGTSDVDIEFLSSEHYSFDKGIVLDSSGIRVNQTPVSDIEVPPNFTPVTDGSLSDDDDLVQMMIGEGRTPGKHDFLFQTMFSELQGIFDDTAALIELPD